MRKQEEINSMNVYVKNGETSRWDIGRCLTRNFILIVNVSTIYSSLNYLFKHLVHFFHYSSPIFCVLFIFSFILQITSRISNLISVTLHFLVLRSHHLRIYLPHVSVLSFLLLRKKNSVLLSLYLFPSLSLFYILDRDLDRAKFDTNCQSV